MRTLYHEEKGPTLVRGAAKSRKRQAIYQGWEEEKAQEETEKKDEFPGAPGKVYLYPH